MKLRNSSSFAKHLAHSKYSVNGVAITLQDSEPHFSSPSFVVGFPLLPVTTLKITERVNLLKVYYLSTKGYIRRCIQHL